MKKQASVDPIIFSLSFPTEKVLVASNTSLFEASTRIDNVYRFISGKAYQTLHSANGTVKLRSLKRGEILGKPPHSSDDNFGFGVYVESDAEFEKTPWSVFEKEISSCQEVEFQHQAHQLHTCQTLIRIFEKIYPTVSPIFLQSIIRLGSFVHLDNSDILFKQGDKTESMYLLLSGKLDVYMKRGANKNKHKVGEIYQGEPFGEMALFSDQPRSATIIAARNCELICLSRDVFNKLAKRFPELNSYVVKSLVERVRSYNSETEQKTPPCNRTLLFLSKSQDIKGQHELALVNQLSKGLNSSGAKIITESRILKNTLYAKHTKIPTSKLTDILDDQEDNSPYNLYFADTNDYDWAKVCLGRTDEIWLIAEADQDEAYIRKMLAPLKSLYSWSTQVKKLILTHKNANPIKQTTQWLHTINPQQHFHLRLHSKESLMRICRHLTDKSHGLILGGGGARGLAQVGVLKAFEEARIPIDRVGGTSMGSIIGGWIAMGLDSQQLTEAVERFFVRINPLGDYTLPLISLSRSRRLDNLLQLGFKDIYIEDLSIPYYCVSSDMSTAEERHHEQGILWQAIRASISIPGIIAPVIQNGHYLVDGGLLNNLPCDLMKDRNKGTITAVDVSPSEDYHAQLEQLPSPWSMLWRRFTPEGRFRIPSIFETMLRSFTLSSTRRQLLNKEMVDRYIQPDVSGISMLDFKSANKAIEAGYRATMEKLDKVK